MYISEGEIEMFLMGANGECSSEEVEKILIEYYDELDKSSDAIMERKFKCEEYDIDYEILNLI